MRYLRKKPASRDIAQRQTIKKPSRETRLPLSSDSAFNLVNWGVPGKGEGKWRPKGELYAPADTSALGTAIKGDELNVLSLGDGCNWETSSVKIIDDCVASAQQQGSFPACKAQFVGTRFCSCPRKSTRHNVKFELFDNVWLAHWPHTSGTKLSKKNQACFNRVAHGGYDVVLAHDCLCICRPPENLGYETCGGFLLTQDNFADVLASVNRLLKPGNPFAFAVLTGRIAGHGPGLAQSSFNEELRDWIVEGCRSFGSSSRSKTNPAVVAFRGSQIMVVLTRGTPCAQSPDPSAAATLDWQQRVGIGKVLSTDVCDYQVLLHSPLQARGNFSVRVLSLDGGELSVGVVPAGFCAPTSDWPSTMLWSSGAFTTDGKATRKKRLVKGDTILVQRRASVITFSVNGRFLIKVETNYSIPIVQATGCGTQFSLHPCKGWKRSLDPVERLY